MVTHKEAARTAIGLFLAKINEDAEGQAALLEPYRNSPEDLVRIVENLTNAGAAAVKYSEKNAKPLTEELFRKLATTVVGLDDAI